MHYDGALQIFSCWYFPPLALAGLFISPANPRVRTRRLKALQVSPSLAKVTRLEVICGCLSIFCILVYLTTCRMHMNWEGSGRKRSSHILKYCLNVCLDGYRKTTKLLIRFTALREENRTCVVPITKQGWYKINRDIRCLGYSKTLQ
jgi:hypothetical protein